uniref:Uncharacterized protein n=1 Tax=Oryza meridionalis TaxID=40149 RepID=A0A0E0D0G1_9ORYZ
MAMQRELEVVGRLPHCHSAPSPFLELLPFFVGLRWQLVSGEAQVVEAIPPSPRLALKGGGSVKSADRGVSVRCGSMKSADGGASVRCGGSYVLPFVCVVVLSWWTAICRQGCRVPGENLVRWFTGLVVATFSGIVTSLGRCRGLPSPFLDKMGDDGILDVVTTMVASFSESCLCGVAVGQAAFGHT